MKNSFFVLFLFVFLLYLTPMYTGVAFVSPLESPLQSNESRMCEADCVLANVECKDYFLRTTIEYTKEEIDFGIERCGLWFVECTNQCFSPTEVYDSILITETNSTKEQSDTQEPFIIETSTPIIITQRRWPLPSSVNIGNTDCTYFTDGTKFCR